VLVGFHGYAQSAEDMLAELERIPGAARWTLVSVQALHRFYTRGDERVVASWMTRQDRELAIADNIQYVDRVVGTLLTDPAPARIAYIGFSQGVAMAYRAAVLGMHRVLGVLAVGGDVPPELKTVSTDRFPAIFICHGDADPWYTKDKVQRDAAVLQSRGVKAEIFQYGGAHEFTPELRHYLGRLLDRLA
jgi:predicted esterase